MEGELWLKPGNKTSSLNYGIHIVLADGSNSITVYPNCGTTANVFHNTIVNNSNCQAPVYFKTRDDIFPKDVISKLNPKS